MCGSLRQTLRAEYMEKLCGVAEEIRLGNRSRFSPIAIVTPDGVKQKTWGREGLLFARRETVLERPTFREAVQRNRVIVPISAFTERSSKTRSVIPFSREGGWAVAGLDLGDCAVILTKPAEPPVLEHHHREPWHLDPSEARAWLDPRFRFQV